MVWTTDPATGRRALVRAAPAEPPPRSSSNNSAQETAAQRERRQRREARFNRIDDARVVDVNQSRCVACGHPVHRYDSAWNTGTRVYHEACFKCATCRRRLQHVQWETVRRDRASGGGERDFCLPHARQMRSRNPMQELYPESAVADDDFSRVPYLY